jgi:hypothetical protein
MRGRDGERRGRSGATGEDRGGGRRGDFRPLAGGRESKGERDFFIVRGPLKAMSTLWHSNSGSVQLTLEVPLVAMEYANMDNNV